MRSACLSRMALSSLSGSLEKSAKTGVPNWIKRGRHKSQSKSGPASECISAGEIEIDAPLNATITIKGNEIYDAVSIR